MRNFVVSLLKFAISGIFYISTVLLVFLLLKVWSTYMAKDRYLSGIQEFRKWIYGMESSIPKPVYHVIYDRNGTLLGEFTPVLGSYIPLQRCEKLKWLRTATVLSEDKDFYSHNGISFRGILRALYVNLKTLSLKQGGGTITQQLARTLFTGNEKTLDRKILETLLALEIEKRYKKEEILCLYLNKIYMGNNRFGAEEASWFYFDKPPEKLTPAEASLLVGMFPAPEKYNPLKNVELALKKQKIVMDKLVEAGYLTKEQAEKDIQTFIKKYRISIDNNDPGSIARFGSNRYFRLNRAPEVNEYVKYFLEENLPPEVMLNYSFEIYTTVDAESQKYALESVRNYIQGIREENRQLYTKHNLQPDLVNHIQGVLVSIDVPTGYIRALVGGYEIYETGILTYRIHRMKRQVGSTIKGFLYALALHRKIYDIHSYVVDEPVNFGGYKPVNWYNSYLGEVSLKRAIARSINTTAIKTLDKLGIDFFIEEIAQSLGMGYDEARKRIPRNLSIALGSFELTPMELTLLYAALLNEGYRITPIIIEKVQTRDGIVVYENDYRQKNIRIVNYEASSGILELLKGVVEEEENGTAGWIGRMKSQKPDFLPYEIAGKTGTTQVPPEIRKKYNNINGIRDSWFVGIIPVNVTTVWIGNDKGIPLQAYAPKVWVDYVSRAFPYPLEQKFPEVKRMDWFDFYREKTDDFR